MYQPRIKSSVILFLMTAVILSGCVSTGYKGSVRLDGERYVRVTEVCRDYNIGWEWDSLSQAITLKKDKKEIKFIVDNSAILINKELEVINPQARFYKGDIVIPLKLKDRIISVFVKPQIISGQKALSQRGKYNIKKIVLDAGHGGKDPGAISKQGLKEKYVTLDIARELKRILEQRGIDVVMTRSSDIFVSLADRAAIANRSGADFFISIHANANKSRAMNGVEVYYHLADQSDILQRAVETKDTSALQSLGVANASNDLRVILWDMVYSGNQLESVRLAQDISGIASKELNAKNGGLKSANFYVLKNCRIASILVEVGYISNFGEERKLRDISYRKDVASAIAKGILGD